MNENEKSCNLFQKDKLKLGIKKENSVEPGDTEPSVNTSKK